MALFSLLRQQCQAYETNLVYFLDATCHCLFWAYMLVRGPLELWYGHNFNFVQTWRTAPNTTRRCIGVLRDSIMLIKKCIGLFCLYTSAVVIFECLGFAIISFLCGQMDDRARLRIWQIVKAISTAFLAELVIRAPVDLLVDDLVDYAEILLRRWGYLDSEIPQPRAATPVQPLITVAAVMDEPPRVMLDLQIPAKITDNSSIVELKRSGELFFEKNLESHDYDENSPSARQVILQSGEIQDVRDWMENMVIALDIAKNELESSKQEVELVLANPVFYLNEWHRIPTEKLPGIVNMIRDMQLVLWRERKRLVSAFRPDLLRGSPDMHRIYRTMELAREDANTVLLDIHPNNSELQEPLILPGRSEPADQQWWTERTRHIDKVERDLDYVMHFASYAEHAMKREVMALRNKWLEKGKILAHIREELFRRLPADEQAKANQRTADTLQTLAPLWVARVAVKTDLEQPD